MRKTTFILLIAGLIPCFGNAAIIKHEKTAVCKIRKPDTFTLKGKIKGQSSGFLRISYATADGKSIQDSCAIKNGTFSFSGKITEPTMAYFSGAVKSRYMDDPNFHYFFLEPAQMSMEVVAGDFKHLKLKGSKTQDEVVSLDQVKAHFGGL